MLYILEFLEYPELLLGYLASIYPLLIVLGSW